MVLGALVGGGKGAETERVSCVSPRGLWKNSGLHALEVPRAEDRRWCHLGRLLGQRCKSRSVLDRA